ncbi:HAMP domain-containing histidine kinase [Erysipelothrix sp. HDW6C]|uniref:sensor histidine kinase n=1 Tax=Erysipelothrix sp. HDW6C TaxID=2714930 RepID=UPI00140B6DE9|nr:HAMP domain-containing sensor histidine kinase [Erysipelothrix sp. HDW6C]QIK70108.1 HAMP domain-containing histidine kinase [Erysipelothrix sp. HDW6C]
MAFRIWFYFLVLTGIMLLFLWMLQISFIGPYYERNRSQTIQNKVTEIERLLARDDFSNAQKSFSKMLAQENMCGAIYNENGTQIMIGDDIGNSCHIKGLRSDVVKEYMHMADTSPTSDFSIRFNSEIMEQGMYFYGKVATVSDYQYYIFINTPIELLDSTVFVLKRQFGLVALAVFSFATFVTFILSRRLSRPIVSITENADRLAKGDLTVEFNETEYSEVKALSRTLNFATQEFKKTDELRRDLVANVSHDIKTPLTMIKAYAEMIQDISGDNPEMREKHLNVIVDEVNHLERLVNDMLTLSKYESKVFDIKETQFKLVDQVQASINLFQMLNIDFEVRVPDDLEVVADEIKMGQVLYNYINNATKYVGDDNKIIIEASLSHDEVIVSVSDHGPGIEAAVVDHVWDRYYKIDKNYIRNTASSGLGLSIVKAICDATGSRCWVESKVGRGSSFYYTLKQVQQQTPLGRNKRAKKSVRKVEKI